MQKINVNNYTSDLGFADTRINYDRKFCSIVHWNVKNAREKNDSLQMTFLIFLLKKNILKTFFWFFTQLSQSAKQ